MSPSHSDTLEALQGVISAKLGPGRGDEALKLAAEGEMVAGILEKRWQVSLN